MTVSSLRAVLVTGALFFAAQTPAFAASPVTDGFLANLTPNLDFLDRSSRMAMQMSKSVRLREFARSQAREQTLAANAVDSWIETGRAPAVVASSEDPGTLQTGRSVGIEGQPVRVVDERLPMGQEDLDKLEGMTGADFDSLYKDRQAVALRQIETDYADYIARGDDPTLMAMASRELPKVRRRLAEVGKL